MTSQISIGIVFAIAIYCTINIITYVWHRITHKLEIDITMASILVSIAWAIIYVYGDK